MSISTPPSTHLPQRPLQRPAAPLVPIAYPAHYACDVVLRNGSTLPLRPALAILRAAEESQADLIVIGAGDRYHVRAMWLGGVTERLLRTAHAPVLIVPAG